MNRMTRTDKSSDAMRLQPQLEKRLPTGVSMRKDSTT